MQKKYPAKILLFGEYTIIKGSQALALPLPHYSGHWEKAAASDNLQGLQQSLPQLLAYLEQQPFSVDLDLAAFRQDLQEGWYFTSSIPRGYGAGSSGALCAAIYDKYVLKASDDLLQLRTQLAQIEHFFHGSSSGTDPLICYLHKAVRIFSTQKLESLSLPPATTAAPVFFLLNTQLARATEPLVKIFMEKCESVDFRSTALEPLSKANNQAIDQLLEQQWRDLAATIQNISALQLAHFSEMIPKAFREIWQQGLLGDQYYLKLCGAGGGGFFLGFTQNWKQCQELLSAYDLIPLSLFTH